MRTKIFAISVRRSVLVVLGFLILLGQAQITLAQWATSGNDISNTNTGNVGVGTTTPGAKLDVAGVTRAQAFNRSTYRFWYILCPTRRTDSSRNVR